VAASQLFEALHDYTFTMGASEDAEPGRLLEESGVSITITGLVGAYSDPGHLMVYPDTGGVRRGPSQFAVFFHALPVGGGPRPDRDETCDAMSDPLVTEVRWFSHCRLPTGVTTTDRPTWRMVPTPTGRSDAAAAMTRWRSCPTTGDRRPAITLLSSVCQILEPNRVAEITSGSQRAPTSV
jgi:hypothetical protein